ncbi:DUF3830 family protein [Candidatus Bathyarchaeota archaeon]|nr:DUF3830 family protein [Candidatus Bathyarchaeota archaeon]MBS7630484.1 DUF3830 family protein [Candidatus Bathyarchaeota archaeon]
MRIFTPSVGESYAQLSSRAPKTCKAIWDALPIESRVNRWGDEIYFSIDLDIEAENQMEVVEKGDLGYWPPGKAFCIFFGLTPISSENEIRAASPVNVFGHLLSDPEVFKKTKDGEKIRIEQG